MSATERTENELLKGKMEKLEEENRKLQDAGYQLSKKEMDFLLDDLRSGYWVWHAGNDYPTVGPSFARMLGYETSEITEDFWLKVVDGEEAREMQRGFLKYLKAQGKESFEKQIRLRHKDGHFLNVWNRGQVSAWEGVGKPQRVVGSVIDVSEVYGSDLFYEESSRGLNLIIEGIEAGIWDGNLQTRKTWYSERFYEMLGYAPGEVDLDNEIFLSRIPEEDQILINTALDRHFQDRKPYYCEFRVRDKSGHYRWMASSGKAVFDADNRPLRMAGSMIDISQRKELELRLNNQNFLFKEAEGMANVGAWEFDLESGNVVWSDHIYRIHGLDRDYAPSKNSVIENFVGNSQEKIAQAIELAIEQAIPYELELQLKTHRGEVIWVKAKGMPITDEEGKVTGLRGVIQDIDDIKKQELELRQKEVLLSEASRTARIGAFSIDIHDPENPVTVWAEELFHVHEVPRDYDIKNAMEFYHEEHREPIIQELTELSQTGKPVSMDVKITSGKGRVKWVRLEAKAIKDETGRVVEIPGFIQDIDEAKRKELEMEAIREELDRQNIRFKAAEKMGRIGAWEYLVEDKSLSWSEEIYRIFELPKDFDPTPVSTDHLLVPGYENEAHAALKKVIEEGGSFEVEFKIKTPKGKEKWVKSMGQAVSNQLGKVHKVEGTFQDITDVKTKELRLEEFNTELNLQRNALLRAEKMARLGSWRYRFDNKFTEWSDQVYLIHDLPLYTELDFSAVVNGFYADFEEEKLHFYESIMAGEGFDFETEINTYQNNQRWVRVKGSPMRDENGEIVGVSGTVQDIDDLKRKQLELQESSEIIGHQNKRLMDFTQIVSHNLRSHTSNIQTMLKFIDQRKDDEERETYLHYIKETVDNLQTTLAHLHDVIKIQNDTNLKEEKLSVEKSLSEMLGILEGEIRLHGVKVEKELKVKQIKYVKSYLDSILLNLLSNAIKYRRDGERPVIKIRTYLDPEKKTPVLEVIDNGTGLNLKRVGKKLFGMYKTFHKHPEARGVGLFITKNQVEAMDGSIEVESKPGDGSVFRVRF